MATRSSRSRPVKPRPRPQGETTVVTEQPSAAEVAAAETLTTETALVDPDIAADAPEIDPDAEATVETESGATVNPDGTEDPDDELAEEADLDESEFRQYWATFLAESGVAAPKGRILYPGEPLTFSGVAINGGDTVLLDEDIYRMVVPMRSRRPTFILEARAGTQVPKVRVVTRTQYQKAVGGLYDAILEEG